MTQLKLITDIKSDTKSFKISNTVNFDSYAGVGVASLAPGIQHCFCIKAFTALWLVFSGTTAVTLRKPLPFLTLAAL